MQYCKLLPRKRWYTFCPMLYLLLKTQTSFPALCTFFRENIIITSIKGIISRIHPDPRQNPSLASIFAPGNDFCRSSLLPVFFRILTGSDRYFRFFNDFIEPISFTVSVIVNPYRFFNSDRC